jgi:spore coat protein JB
MMNMRFASEQEKLLHDISLLSFVVVELNLYLDTHPDDQNALEYFNHYNRMSNRAKKEYSAKYEPLTIACAGTSEYSDWKWTTSPMPWEGGCN